MKGAGINSFFSRARQAIWADHLSCIVCNAEMKPKLYANGEGGFYGVCPDCQTAFSRNSESICLVCGTPVTNLSLYCLHCTERSPSFDIARSTLLFESNFKKVVYRFKFGNDKWLARYLAPYLVEEYDAIGMDADVVVAVPLAQKRKRWRGYNQSEELAKEFSRLTGVPYNFNIIKKVRDTFPQSSLTRDERAENLRNAFEVQTAEYKEEIKGKIIVIIDDIYTTGATFNECASTLKKLKPSKIIALALATPSFGAKEDEG